MGHAVEKLAKRFEDDDLDFAGYLKLSRNTPLSTLDRSAASLSPDSAEANDAIVIETLLEFAGESDESAGRLLSWISQNISPTLDAEEFLTARGLAEARRNAHEQLLKE